MNSPELNQEEIENLLKQLGVIPGDWNPVGGNPVHFPFVKDQLGTLTKLRDYLTGLAESDIQTVNRLREQIVRLQRGGGV